MSLQKMLVVGVGGSGGKTLRVLRDELNIRLRSRDWKGDLPAAWQFLHIDTLDRDTNRDPELPPALPTAQYQSLSSAGLSYSNVDDYVCDNPDLLQSVAGWRPPPSEVRVNFKDGAGQYRALGRMAIYGSMPLVVQALRRRIAEMTVASADSQLDDVSHIFNVKPSGRRDPLILVVGSIAGGSGSGIFLDVCDAVRLTAAEKQWTSDILGLLYAPDLFNDLDQRSRSQMQGNALAAITELLAARLNSEQPLEGEFALLHASELSSSNVSGRGPDVSFLVGRESEHIRFESPNQVFLAAGRALASWVTDAGVAANLKDSLTGNKQANASAIDNTHLSRDGAQILSSFGCATVGLARDRFARYATDRLAAEAVNVLLEGDPDGKRSQQDPSAGEEKNREAETDERAKERLPEFRARTRLNEFGRNNDILDALEGPGASYLASLSGKLDQSMLDEVQDDGLTAHEAESRIERELNRFSRQYASDLDKLLSDRVRAWADQIQDLVLAESLRLAQLDGLVVARKTLSLLREELSTRVTMELRGEADTARTRADNALLTRLFDAAAATMDAIREAIGRRTEPEKLKWQAKVRITAVELITDFCNNFMLPLEQAIDREHQALLSASTPRPDRQSDIEVWRMALSAPPKSLLPPNNHLLLEEVSDFPSIYSQLLKGSVAGAKTSEEAVRLAIIDAFGGSGETGNGARGHLGSIAQRWSPQVEVVLETGKKAILAFDLGTTTIHDRIEEWVRLPGRAMGDYVHESLKDYLKKQKGGAHQERLEKFAARFRQALDFSAPLVSINSVMLQKIHGVTSVNPSRLLSQIPFSDDHPAYKVTSDILEGKGMKSEAFRELFGDGNVQHIDITTFLPPHNPFVFESLIQPIENDLVKRRTDNQGGIGDFWVRKRARQLPFFIPVEPNYRRLMIRGWWLARILGEVEGVDGEQFARQPISIKQAGAPARFPFPLLGPTVKKGGDVLPAILESLPLALMAAVSAGSLKPSLDPYYRLLELGNGSPIGGHEPIQRTIHEDFRSLINDGGNGDAIPEVEAATDLEGRLQAVESYLRKALDLNKQISAESPDRELAGAVRRAWELRTDIRMEIDSLLEDCASLRDKQAEPERA